MILSNLEIVITGLASFFTSFFLTNRFRKIALRLGVVDSPNQTHKTHTQPVPYLGGLSIVTTSLIGMIAGFLILRPDTVGLGEVLLLILPPTFLSVIGLLDDIANLKAFPRFVAQTISSLVVSILFFINGFFGTPSTSSALNLLISIIWIIGITNAFNFIDNLDGGAGGVAVIATATLLTSSLISGQELISACAVLLLGATLGFLVWNIHPARIYLGDAGALFIGSLLAALLIRLHPQAPSLIAAWFVPAFILAVPVLDTSVAVTSRIIRRVSPFQGGKDHISHRLIKIGFSRKQAAISIWLLATYFCAFSLILQFIGKNDISYILGIAIISWLICFFSLLRLSTLE